MKFYRLFPSFMILTFFFIPNFLFCSTSSIVPIYKLVDESDIVFKGTVTSALFVFDDPRLQDNSGGVDVSEGNYGSLFEIKVNKVLYANETIKQAIFSKRRIVDINEDLKKNPKRKPVKLFAFRSDQGRGGLGGPEYYSDELQLYFLKVSKFPAQIPSTALIVHENWSPNGSEFPILTKSDLKEEHCFEAARAQYQSTWVLSDKWFKKRLPTVEAFCEVMSIPNPCRREQELRPLLNSMDKHLAANAAAALRKIERTRKAKQTPLRLEQKR